MQDYRWTTVSLLCGTLYQFAKPFDVTACQSLKAKLRATDGSRYDVNIVEFDPEKRQLYEPILAALQNQSRGMRCVLFYQSDVGLNGEFLWIFLLQ